MDCRYFSPRSLRFEMPPVMRSPLNPSGLTTAMHLPDRFGEVLRPRRIAVVRDIRLVADLERVLLETSGVGRLDDAPGARREHVGFDPVRSVGDLHLAAGEHEERAGRAIRKFGDQRLDGRGVAAREEILADDADAEVREERELAGYRIAEPRVDAKNYHVIVRLFRQSREVVGATTIASRAATKRRAGSPDGVARFVLPPGWTRIGVRGRRWEMNGDRTV
jgi:hypothetical protein